MQKEQLPFGIRSSNQMRQILGVSEKYFQIILNRFSILVVESEHYAFYSNPKRKRKIGGGRKSKLPTDADKLAFCLYYLKNYPIFSVLANRFDMSASRAHDNLKRYLPFLHLSLVELGVEPVREFENNQALSDYLKKKALPH